MSFAAEQLFINNGLHMTGSLNVNGQQITLQNVGTGANVIFENIDCKNAFSGSYAALQTVKANLITSSIINADYLVSSNHIVSKGPVATTITTTQSYISNLALTGTDSAGTFSFTCQGTATAGNVYLTINFANSYALNPIVIITPANMGAGDFNKESSFYVPSTTTDFSLVCANDLPNSSATYNCVFNYLVVGVFM